MASSSAFAFSREKCNQVKDNSEVAVPICKMESCDTFIASWQLSRIFGEGHAALLHSPTSPAHSELIAVTLLLPLSLSSLDANLLVVLLEGCEVFTCLRKLALLHALPDVPVDESAF